jgi:hypothetical protein
MHGVVRRGEDGRVEQVWTDADLRPLYDRHCRGESINKLSAETLVPRSTLQRRFRAFKKADLRAKVNAQARKRIPEVASGMRPEHMQPDAERVIAERVQEDAARLRRDGGSPARSPSGATGRIGRITTFASAGDIALGLDTPGSSRGRSPDTPEYRAFLDRNDQRALERAAAKERGDEDRVQAFTLDGRAVITTSRANAAAKGLTLLTGDPAADRRAREGLLSAAGLPGHTQEPAAPPTSQRVRDGMRLAEEAARRNTEAAGA